MIPLARADESDSRRFNSAGLVQRLCDGCLEGLRGRQRHFLGERRKLLGLLGEHLELLARMFIESSTNSVGDFTAQSF